MSSFSLLCLVCLFVGFTASISVDQIDVAAIKGSRDVVPAEEILDLIKPFLKPKTGLLQGIKYVEKHRTAVLNLISNLGFTSLSTGKSFSLDISKQGTWIEGWSNCISSRKKFATIESAAEQLQVVQLMFTQGISNYYVWLAGIDISSGGNFTWVGENCGVSMGYTDWVSGAPDNYAGDEHCLATSIAGWDDLSCTDNTYYLCQS